MSHIHLIYTNDGCPLLAGQRSAKVFLEHDLEIATLFSEVTYSGFLFSECRC